MKNNKGFSLVELLVVIAILGIVAVMSSLSYSAVRRADVTKAANTVDSMMSQVRMDNMSSGQAEYMYIYVDDDNVYYKLSNTKVTNVTQIKNLSEEATLLCADSIAVSYTKSAAGSSQLSSTVFLAISFEKTTGAFNCFDSVNNNKIDLTEINFQRGGKNNSITIANETGKHVLS